MPAQKQFYSIVAAAIANDKGQAVGRKQDHGLRAQGFERQC